MWFSWGPISKSLVCFVCFRAEKDCLAPSRTSSTSPKMLRIPGQKPLAFREVVHPQGSVCLWGTNVFVRYKLVLKDINLIYLLQKSTGPSWTKFLSIVVCANLPWAWMKPSVIHKRRWDFKAAWYVMQGPDPEITKSGPQTIPPHKPAFHDTDAGMFCRLFKTNTAASCRAKEWFGYNTLMCAVLLGKMNLWNHIKKKVHPLLYVGCL